jgi:competence protein ComEC
MPKSKVFFFFCLSFIGGIFLSSFSPAGALAKAVLAILGVTLISVFWKYKKLVVVGFSVLFLLLGIWNHQRALADIPEIPEGEITFIGEVAADPDIRQTHTKLTLIEVSPRSIKGKVLVTTGKYPEYHYGDKLKIKGYLEAPQVFEDFNYKDYLLKDGIYSVMYYPKIELLGESDRGLTSIIYGGILKIKDKLREVINQNLSPPQSSILGAVILGDKRQISNEWKTKLNYAGIRHLTAVSGMHVAVLIVILMSSLTALGFWRHHSFYFTIVLITLFIIMTGFQPSAIRASIMAGFFLLAHYLGRANVSSRAVVFAAALMLVHNPLLLKLDVGFQLSFLAVMGIIYFLPYFQKYFGEILAMTLSAQVFTLPVLIYNFGYFSLTAPLTNILIVPLLPFLMGLGFLFVIFGTIWQPLGWLLSLPVWLLLTYIIKVADWFSTLPFSVYFIEVSWIWILVFYSVLGFIAWRLHDRINKWNKKPGLYL